MILNFFPLAITAVCCVSSVAIALPDVKEVIVDSGIYRLPHGSLLIARARSKHPQAIQGLIDLERGWDEKKKEPELRCRIYFNLSRSGRLRSEAFSGSFAHVKNLVDLDEEKFSLEFAPPVSVPVIVKEPEKKIDLLQIKESTADLLTLSFASDILKDDCAKLLIETPSLSIAKKMADKPWERLALVNVEKTHFHVTPVASSKMAGHVNLGAVVGILEQKKKWIKSEFWYLNNSVFGWIIKSDLISPALKP